MTPLELRLAITAAVLTAALVALGAFAWHEREVGAQNLKNSVNQATIAAQHQADAETKQLQARADKAAEDAIDAQKQLADYMDAHPVGPVRVLVSAGGGSPGVRKASPAPGPGAAPRPGPEACSDVPRGGEEQSVDIGPEVDAVVRGFGALAISLRESQGRR